MSTSAVASTVLVTQERFTLGMVEFQEALAEDIAVHSKDSALVVYILRQTTDPISHSQAK